MLEDGKDYKFLAIVENINRGEDWANVNVILQDKTRYNVKLESESSLEVGKIYHFETTCRVVKEKACLFLVNAQNIYSYIQDKNELETALNSFYSYAPMSVSAMEKIIDNHMNQIKNDVIKRIASNIYLRYRKEFYVFPAATKFHHAYIGGLAYHTATMLLLADGIIDVYPYLNKDLVYAGIILHDIGKVKELESPENPSYTTDGQLLGHMTIAVLEVEKEALNLGSCDLEEVKLLEHIIISSHGVPQFGSPKKPMIGEALLVWYIDTIDSKFTVLKEELEGANKGFTEPIPVLDKMKFYNHKL